LLRLLTYYAATWQPTSRQNRRTKKTNKQNGPQQKAM